MKSFFTYFSLSVLLLVCYLEKQWAGAAREQSRPRLVGDHPFLVGRFASNHRVSRVAPSQIHAQTSHRFAGASHRFANSGASIDLIGKVTRQNELNLIDPAKIKRQGASFNNRQKTENALFWVSGFSLLHDRPRHDPFLGQQLR